MPRLDLEQNHSGHFGFSHVKLDELGASEYTLVSVAVDTSGSTSGFSRDMENVIKQVVEACSLSPRADNLLLRMIKFDNRTEEIHGFKLLQDCQLADYDGILNPGGNTALIDSVINGMEALNVMAKTLRDSDYTVNGVCFIITDGMENDSSLSLSQLKKVMKAGVTDENLQSISSILIGIGDQSFVEQYLQSFKTEAGIDEYKWFGEANKQNLAKMGKFVSQSVSSKSSSLSGAGATSLTI